MFALSAAGERTHSLFSLSRFFPGSIRDLAPAPRRGASNKNTSGVGQKEEERRIKNGKGKRMGKSGKELFLSFIFLPPLDRPIAASETKGNRNEGSDFAHKAKRIWGERAKF